MPQRPLSVQPPFSNRAASDPRNTKIGKVFLVGAGPGDPGLITVRGAECLAAADVVLYDGLANPSLLRLAGQAQLISVGKHGSGPLWSQEEINQQLVALASQGLHVVRLKGGDPAVFARTAEELEAISMHSIPFEVVPGITAALAAASYVGIPITHRDHASAVAFITGQQQTDAAQDIDWSALAHFPGTLVFYMGVTTAGLWSKKLIEHGKPADTPAAIVRRCTWRDQKVIRCALQDVAGHLTPASKLRPPVIVIIGQVATLGERFNWFDSLPLRGVGVWLTRPAEQNARLAEKLRELGAEVFDEPVTHIEPPVDVQALDEALKRLRSGRYTGVALTSRNAIDAVFARMKHLDMDCRAFAHVAVACVGQKTADYLATHGLRADIVPPAHFSAESLVKAIAERGLAAAAAWLLPQADAAAVTLEEGLAAAGARVDRVTAYRSVPVDKLPGYLQEAIDRGDVQMVTVTSGLIAEVLHSLLTADQRRKLKPISLSPAIAQILTEMGWPAAAVATEATEDSLALEILNLKINTHPS